MLFFISCFFFFLEKPTRRVDQSNTNGESQRHNFEITSTWNPNNNNKKKKEKKEKVQKILDILLRGSGTGSAAGWKQASGFLVGVDGVKVRKVYFPPPPRPALVDTKKIKQWVAEAAEGRVTDTSFGLEDTFRYSEHVSTLNRHWLNSVHKEKHSTCWQLYKKKNLSHFIFVINFHTVKYKLLHWVKKKTKTKKRNISEHHRVPNKVSLRRVWHLSLKRISLYDVRYKNTAEKCQKVQIKHWLHTEKHGYSIGGFACMCVYVCLKKALHCHPVYT